jgi:hypothetical protein
MKKYLLAIVIASVLPIYGQEKTTQPHEDQRAAKNAVKPKTDKPVAPPETRVVINEDTTNGQENRAEEGSKNYFDKNVAIAGILINCGLLIAGSIGICVTIKTLKAIQRQGLIMIRQARIMQGQATVLERQTKAVEDSVSLQKTLKRQWLEYDNWRIQPAWERSISTDIRLLFDITNNTDMPLTIRSITLSVNLRNTTTSARTEIPPKKSHPVFLDLDNLTRDQVQEYIHDNLVLTVMGSVSYKDAFRDDRYQGISRIFMGGRSGFTSTEGPGWIPYEEEDDD